MKRGDANNKGQLGLDRRLSMGAELESCATGTACTRQSTTQATKADI